MSGYCACRRRAGSQKAFALIEAACLTFKDLRFQYLMARERMRRGEFALAKRCYESILAQEPADSAEIGLAQALQEQGCWLDAQLRLSALAGRGTSWQAFVHLARVLVECGDEAGAADALARARHLFPAVPQIILAEARQNRVLQRHEAAITGYRDYVAQVPGDVDAQLELVAFMEQAGMFDQAQIVLGQTVARHQGHPSVLAAQGRAAHAADKLHEALDLLRQCLSIDPGRINVHHTVARVLISLGETEAGFSQIDLIEAKTGPRPDHHYVRAEQARRLGYLERALDIATQAHTLFPDDIMVWSQLSIIRIDLGYFELVRSSLTAAPARRRADVARVNLVAGALALAEWRTQEAAQAFGRAKTTMPMDRWLMDRTVQCDLLNLELENAKTHLVERAVLNVTMNRRRNHTTNWSQNFLGQLFNEYRMDIEALTRMKTLGPVDDEAGMDGFRGIVHDFPDHTAVALQFLIGARRAGYLNSMPSSEAVIPARLSQFWDSDELPPDIADYCASWRNLNPDFDYHRFTLREATAFLTATCDARVVAAFRRAREPAMKADLFRLAYLLEKGGFYTDADDRCQRSLNPLRCSGHSLITYQEDLGSIGNNFIAAVPGHPVIRAALTQATEAINRGDQDVLWLSTGPGLISRVIALHVCRAPSLREGFSGMAIMARHEMLHYAAIHCATSYKHTDKHWSRSAFNSAKIKPV